MGFIMLAMPSRTRSLKDDEGLAFPSPASSCCIMGGRWGVGDDEEIIVVPSPVCCCTGAPPDLKP